MAACTYLDVPRYLRAATNQETASLLGLATTLAEAAPVGALSLSVESSVGWAAGPLWLLDGATCEVVRVLGAVDATHLSLAAPGTAFTHAVGVSASQAGSGGALAEVLLRASAWLENYCQHGALGDRALYALPRTERWGMPGPRAWLDRDGLLCVRPGHIPVQSVSALRLEDALGQALALDATLARVASSGRVVEAPAHIGLPAQSGLGTLPPGISRGRRAWVVLSYTGGVPLDAVPYDLVQAGVLIASELLALRRNPSGAALVRQGKFEVQARPRVDPTGDSLLVLQAKALLEPYRWRG